MTTVTRVATVDDFEALFWRAPPEVWCGHAIEIDGQLVGMGLVAWQWGPASYGDSALRAWVSLNLARRVSPYVLHRGARRLLAALDAAGEEIVYSFSDPRRPDMDRWLRRLGFEIDLEVAIPGNAPVWSRRPACTPSI
jgi:hypothetical protein